MKRYKEIIKRIKLTGIAIFGLFVASCSNEETRMPETETSEEGKVRVSFMIPKGSGEFGTRAYDTSREGFMSNLYVVAVQTASINYESDSDKTGTETATSSFDIFPLDPTGYTITVGSQEYQKYDINLFPGKYRFYVLANLDLYLGQKVSSLTTEEDVKNIVLHYNADTPIVPGHLPMACVPSEIKYGISDENQNSTSDSEDYVVTLHKQGKNTPQYDIYAEMRFLCAKVRCTILFNRNTFSSAFGQKNTIRFYADDSHLPYATVIREMNRLDRNLTPDGFGFTYLQNGNGYASWSFEMNRYYYPGTIDANGNVDPSRAQDGYPSRPSDELVAWDKTLAEWINSNKDQRAWQGVVYLPENDVDKVQRTVLHFPYIFNESPYEGKYDENGDLIDSDQTLGISGEKLITLFGDNNQAVHYDREENPDADYKPDSSNHVDGGDVSTHGLTKNMMYDVVAKVVTPDKVEIKVDVFVRVKPWDRILVENEW